MDYEKKYKELVGKIKKAYLYAQTDSTKAVLEDILPELAESEDERIRKSIIELVKQSSHILNPMNQKSMIAWLEKQGEKKSKEVSIWKHWNNGIAGNGEGKLIYLVKSGNTYRLSSCLGFECDYIELLELDKLYVEKQGGQPPTWSEEDEKTLSIVIEKGDLKPSEIQWLKCLKERVWPQSKQEWSKEDKEQLNRAICMIGELEWSKSCDDVYTWLLSLRKRMKGE